MSKFLRMTSLVATVTGIAIAATPALAVPAQTDAGATVEIRKGLTLDSAQGLDLGIVVLSGTAPFSADVSVDRDGNFDCDGGSGDVTCSGSTQEARYDVTGSAGYVVDIDSNPAGVTLDNGNGDQLTLTADHDDTVTLDATGAYNFGVGGSITVTDATVDGVYTGTFEVTAEYN